MSAGYVQRRLIKRWVVVFRGGFGFDGRVRSSPSLPDEPDPELQPRRQPRCLNRVKVPVPVRDRA